MSGPARRRERKSCLRAVDPAVDDLIRAIAVAVVSGHPAWNAAMRLPVDEWKPAFRRIARDRIAADRDALLASGWSAEELSAAEDDLVLPDACHEVERELRLVALLSVLLR